MAANGVTQGFGGKRGLLGFHTSGGTRLDLHLTKWGLHLKADEIDVTSTKSPLGYSGQEPTLASEWITGVLDGEITFEGIYTYADSLTNPQTNMLLFGAASGTGQGVVPGTNDTGTTPTGVVTYILEPDSYDQPTYTITGNGIVTTLDLDAEIRDAVKFKGTLRMSGGYTRGGTL